MPHVKIQRRSNARIHELNARDVGHRLDLILADFRMAGPDISTVAIHYAGGAPTAEEITDFFIAKFDHNVEPLLATARVHVDARVTSLNVVKACTTTEYDNRKFMAQIAPGKYLHRTASADETWEVQNIEGVPSLFRAVPEDLSTLLATHAQIAAGVKLDSLLAEGMAMVIPASMVRFFDKQDGSLLVAKVLTPADPNSGFFSAQVTGSDISIRIHANQIVDVLATEEMKQSTKAKLMAYFTKVWGAEYAAQLVTADVDGNVSTQATCGSRDDLLAFLTNADYPMFQDPRNALAWVDNVRIAGGKVLRCGPEGMLMAVAVNEGFMFQIDPDCAERALK